MTRAWQVGDPIPVERTYLQMVAPPALEPVDWEGLGASLERMSGPPERYRHLYREVGRPYHWVDRLDLPDEAIRAHLAEPAVALWALFVGGAPAGYYELITGDDGGVEIAYFGLLPTFLGRGLGKALLTDAIQRAWLGGASRVWLHTCTLDDPAAMPNYLKRGFVPFRTESYVARVVTGERCAHCRALLGHAP